LSWNGTSGRFINAFRDDGKSAMMGDGSFGICSINSGDNIQEIKAALPDIEMDWGDYKTNNYPYITYGWNGSQYGFWSSVDKLLEMNFSQRIE